MKRLLHMWVVLFAASGLICWLGCGHVSAQHKKKTRTVPVSYTRIWKYETPALAGLSAGADGGIVAVPLADGRIVALNPDDGSLLWSTDLGGIMSAPPLVTTNAVYVSTSREGVPLEGVLRSLDRSTGLTLWTREMPKPVSSNLVPYDGQLYFGSLDGSVYAVRADTGAAVWSFPTRGSVRGQIAFAGREVLVGSDDGALYSIDRTTGTELWRFQTTGPVAGRAVSTQRRLYLTSGDGSAYALDALTHKLVWRSRTGAAIEAGPVLVEDDRIVVASFDNFVYLLDAKTGDRLWKRRMNGRLVSEPAPDGQDRLLVAPLRDDRLTVLGLETGDKVAAFPLDQGDELVGPPTLAVNLLLVPTDTGLIAARPVGPGDHQP